MTNNDVIQAFLSCEDAKSLNMRSVNDGNSTRLFSYETVIAEIVGGHLLLNNTKYGSTSSTHRSKLESALEGWRPNIKRLTLAQIPKNTTRLRGYVKLVY